MSDSSSCCKTGVRLGLLAAAVAIVPFFLPRRPRIARRIIIRADRSHLFPLINDLRNWPRWTAWNQRDEIGYHYEGPFAGVGATQYWNTRGHAGVLHVKQSVPEERIAYTLLIDEEHRMEGAIALEDIAPNQTLVTWMGRWQGSGKPWMRYLDLLMMWLIGRDFTVGLNNLRHLAETTSPIPEAAAAAAES